MTLSFQQGGTLPFAEYLPFTGVSSDAETSIPLAGGTGNTSGASTSLDDLFKLLNQLKGLPSDTGKLIEDVLEIYNEMNLYNDGTLNTADLTTAYLSTLLKMKYSEYNAKLFDEALKLVTANGGLHEYAIDESGRLIVLNAKTGKLKHMSLSDFYALGDEPEYIPLTNSNLLYYRAESPDFAFKNDVLSTVSNGIGLEKVTEMLLKAISLIGTDNTSMEGYTVKLKDEITKGLDILLTLYLEGHSAEEIWGPQGLLSLDGVYKTKLLTSDLKSAISKAANYLWKTMPANARTWLSIRSGNTEKPQEGAYELMLNLLFAKNSHTSLFSADLQENLNTDGTKKSSSSGSGSEEKRRVGWLQHVLAGDGGRVATMHVNLGGDNFAAGMSITGTGYGLAMEPNGEIIGQTSMLNMLLLSRLLGIAKGSNNIYFGEQKVGINDLNNIAYTGEELLRVNLPVNEDGSPNFLLLRDYNEAYQEYLLSNLTAEDLKRIFGSKPNLSSLVNADGTLNMSKFAPFVLVNGMTTNGLVDISEDNQYIAEMSPSESLYQLLNLSLKTGTAAKPIYPDIDEYSLSEKPFRGWAEWLNSYDHIYKGVIYIPISMNRNASTMYENLKIPQGEQDALELEYQQNPAFLNFNADGNSIDFLNN